MTKESSPNIVGRFTLKNSDYFLLPGNEQMLHLATIGYGMREFILMYYREAAKLYIEEVVLETKDFDKDVWANFKFIEDDSLANDLAEFAEERGLRDMKKITEKCIDMGRPEWTQPPRKILLR